MLMSFLAIACRAHAADTLCTPDSIGIFRADDPTMERVDVTWKGNTYRKYFKGRVADHGKNEEEFEKWLMNLEEKVCDPTKS